MLRRMMNWVWKNIRDSWRGYTDADIESMHLKLNSGKAEFTHAEHTAYVCEVQEGDKP